MTNTKETFYLVEGQDAQSHREGVFYTGTLTAAKRQASRSRFFQGTTLMISETHNGEVLALIATKAPGEPWETAEGWL